MESLNQKWLADFAPEPLRDKTFPHISHGGVYDDLSFLGLVLLDRAALGAALVDETRQDGKEDDDLVVPANSSHGVFEDGSDEGVAGARLGDPQQCDLRWMSQASLRGDG